MNTQNDNSNTDEFLIFGSFFEDSIEFINIPRKYPWTSQHAAFRSIGQRATVKGVVAIVSANALIVILGLLFVYSQMAYWPPVYEDLKDPLFDLAFFLLMFTSFFVNAIIHFFIFRAIMGQGELIAHMYLSAIGYTWSLISVVVAGVILVIVRIRNIDSVVIVLASIYLIYLTFLSMQAIHRLSNIRTIISMVIVFIVTIPGVLLYIFLFGFLRESRPFQPDNLHLIVFFLSIAILNFNIFAYMLREQRQQHSFSEKVGAQSLVSTKITTSISIILSVPLAISVGLSFFTMSRPEPVIVSNSSLKLLGYYVIDAEYSHVLNSIVMISDEPAQIHVYDPVLDIQNSIDILNAPTKVVLNDAGTHAAVNHHGNDNISYVDLRSGQIQLFNVGESCHDITLADEQILCSYGGSHYGVNIKSVDASTGNMTIRRQRYLGTLKLFPSSERLLEIRDGRDIYDRERISGFQAESLWFSLDRRRFISENAQVFDVGVGEHRTKHVGDLQGIGSIVGMSHWESFGTYLVIAENGQGVVLFDDITFEQKEEIPFPEIQVDRWTEGNFPQLETLFYIPSGRFIFANDKIPEYYMIVYVQELNLGESSVIIVGDRDLND